MGVRGRRAADPTLKKASCYAITDFDAGYTGTDFDHLPSAVRERHEVRLRGHSVGAQDNRQVAKIERAGRNLDQDLARAWLWDGKIDLNECVNSSALRQLIGTHVAARSSSFRVIANRRPLPNSGCRSNQRLTSDIVESNANIHADRFEKTRKIVGPGVVSTSTVKRH